DAAEGRGLRGDDPQGRRRAPAFRRQGREVRRADRQGFRRPVRRAEEGLAEVAHAVAHVAFRGDVVRHPGPGDGSPARAIGRRGGRRRRRGGGDRRGGRRTRGGDVRRGGRRRAV